MAPRGRAPFKWPVLCGEYFATVTSELTGTHSRLSQILYALKEFAVYLLDLDAPAMEPCFGFCQQHLEFHRGLPTYYYPGPILFKFRVRMGAGVSGVSNMVWSTDSFLVVHFSANRNRLVAKGYQTGGQFEKTLAY